jgi:hypothetical protein
MSSRKTVYRLRERSGQTYLDGQVSKAAACTGDDHPVSSPTVRIEEGFVCCVFRERSTEEL